MEGKSRKRQGEAREACGESQKQGVSEVTGKRKKKKKKCLRSESAASKVRRH